MKYFSLFFLALAFVMCKKDGSQTAAPTFSSEKKITAFEIKVLNPVVGATVQVINASIDENAKTIKGTVSAGTNITALTPTIMFSNKATVSPVSGETKDFTNAIIYTVTAEDGTKQSYTTTITKATTAKIRP